MLRYKDRIRLTPKERAVFAALPGEGVAAPTTVVEYNAALESAADVWSAGDSAEEQLAALLARDQMLVESPQPVCEDGTPLAASPSAEDRTDEPRGA